MALSKISSAGTTGLGRRNLIINGAMQVAQRGTSFTAQTSEFVVDRFWYNSSGVATMDLSQSSDAPDGFLSSAKLTLNAVDSSIGSTDYYQLTHKIEGQNMAHLDWGSSSAKTVTISFWVKSSVAGDFPLRFINSDGSRSYATYVTIDATDTWEYKTKVIPGPTDGTFLTTSGTGIEIGISFAVGSTYAGATANQWNTVSGFASSNLVNNTGWIGTTDNTFQITGVQLEVGSTATEFEHRSYGEELLLCQRYFERFNYVNSAMLGIATLDATSSGYVPFYYSEKRGDPTFSSSASGQTSGTFSLLTQNGGYPTTTGSVVAARISPKNMRLNFSGYLGLAGAGYSAFWYGNGDTFINIDAEL